jgi:hypothetical protein
MDKIFKVSTVVLGLIYGNNMWGSADSWRAERAAKIAALRQKAGQGQAGPQAQPPAPPLEGSGVEKASGLGKPSVSSATGPKSPPPPPQKSPQPVLAAQAERDRLQQEKVRLERENAAFRQQLQAAQLSPVLQEQTLSTPELTAGVQAEKKRLRQEESRLEQEKSILQQQLPALQKQISPKTSPNPEPAQSVSELTLGVSAEKKRSQRKKIRLERVKAAFQQQFRAAQRELQQELPSVPPNQIPQNPAPIQSTSVPTVQKSKTLTSDDNEARKYLLMGERAFRVLAKSSEPESADSVNTGDRDTGDASVVDSTVEIAKEVKLPENLKDFRGRVVILKQDLDCLYKMSFDQMADETNQMADKISDELGIFNTLMHELFGNLPGDREGEEREWVSYFRRKIISCGKNIDVLIGNMKRWKNRDFESPEQWQEDTKTTIEALEEGVNNFAMTRMEFMEQSSSEIAELQRRVSYANDEIAKLQEQLNHANETISGLQGIQEQLEAKLRRRIGYTNDEVIDFKVDEKGNNFALDALDPKQKLAGSECVTSESEGNDSLHFPSDLGIVSEGESDAISADGKGKDVSKVSSWFAKYEEKENISDKDLRQIFMEFPIEFKESLAELMNAYGEKIVLKNNRKWTRKEINNVFFSMLAIKKGSPETGAKELLKTITREVTEIEKKSGCENESEN